MPDALSRRHFGSLLLTGGAGLLLGPSLARANPTASRPARGRIAAALTSAGLRVELHLHNLRDEPLLIPRGQLGLTGSLHARGRDFSLASLREEPLPLLNIGSRVGPSRPLALSLAPDAEGLYATYLGPVPAGLTGAGRGTLQLRTSHTPSPFAAPLLDGLTGLPLRGRLRYDVST